MNNKTSIGQPSAKAVHDFLQKYGITGSQAARMMYLSGSRQVRKYTGGDCPRQMDGAKWFSLHAHQMLPPETVAEIEAAMEKDLHSGSIKPTQRSLGRP